jgi:hypothetical protein
VEPETGGDKDQTHGHPNTIRTWSWTDPDKDTGKRVRNLSNDTRIQKVPLKLILQNADPLFPMPTKIEEEIRGQLAKIAIRDASEDMPHCLNDILFGSFTNCEQYRRKDMQKLQTP